MSARYTLSLQCPDQPGIVHAVSAAILRLAGNVTDSQQFSDPQSGVFCLRTAFDVPGDASVDAITKVVQEETLHFSPQLTIHDVAVPPRILVMVSNVDHCLVDLLYRHHMGELHGLIPLVVGNHPEPAAICAAYGIAFIHLPATSENRADVEREVRHLIATHDIDLIVLARYMQILSPEFCQDFPGRIINIHHSFLPGFKGARPYHQAYARGVKLIGATAHYVTSDLDEGPIIEQDVVRVSHRHEPNDLVVMGRDLERTVLARAVKLHTEDRVVLIGDRTVVFAR